MIKIIVSAAALALMSGAALAAGSMSGQVRSYNAQDRTIVFMDGETASIPLEVAVPADLHAGSHATVIFNDHTGSVGTVFTESLLGHFGY